MFEKYFISLYTLLTKMHSFMRERDIYLLFYTYNIFFSHFLETAFSELSGLYSKGFN